MCDTLVRGIYDRKVHRVRDLSCGDARIYLEFELRRVWCRRCGAVKQEGLPWLADSPFYTKRFNLRLNSLRSPPVRGALGSKIDILSGKSQRCSNTLLTSR